MPRDAVLRNERRSRSPPAPPLFAIEPPALVLSASRYLAERPSIDHHWGPHTQVCPTVYSIANRSNHKPITPARISANDNAPTISHKITPCANGLAPTACKVFFE